uniref:Secreted protein n=1 Tax=Achlya hypogyna TaxID=1202772 RepID=A0A0A7CN53_ACHHY|nr:secreted protein [Achlya hypogyna]
MKTLAALATVSVGATAISLYVDPALGNDISNDGSLAHPFQSIPKAQAAVRDLLRAQQIAGTPAPIDVILRGGTHVLSSTLTFGPQDSGSTALNRVSYKAYCNPTAPSDLTVLPYPYVMNTTTELRDLWNGVSSPASWTGPADPLAQLGIRPSSTPSPPVVLPPVCFDLVGVGHTCYTVEAPCVSDCMTACQRNVDKRVYSTAVYDQFYLLFGRDLRNEDECNGLCARMCTTCEQPVISGMKTLVNAAWSTYTPAAWHQPTGTIYKLNLTSQGVTSMTQLYLNGNTQLPRAGFPDSILRVLSEFIVDIIIADGSWVPAYLPVLGGSARTLSFNTSTFSTKITNWTSLSTASVEVKLRTGENVWYTLYNRTNGSFELGAGGGMVIRRFRRCVIISLGQVSQTIFENGAATTTASFRTENIFAEVCDVQCASYEIVVIFFDAATAMLYVIPPVGVNLQTSTISFPVLKQLVQVQGTPGIDVAFSVPGYYTILTAGETETAAPAPQVGWTSHLTFDGITFTGTLRSEMELCIFALRCLSDSYIYEALPGHPWTQTRVAAVYIESADDIIIQRSTFRQIGGNTIVISARNQGVQVVHNHFYSVGATAVAVLPRGVTAFPNIRSFEFMNTIASNISYNQMHDYGQVTTQSAAILLLAANRTTVKGNLVFAIPTGGVSYSISNANGDETKPGYLVRPLAAPITLPVTLATSLATNYTTVVDIGRFDISVVAKIIGAPICPPSQGRVGALYGQQHSACSGCCRTTSGTASIQNTALGSQSLLAVALRPGDQLQLQVTSAPYFEAPVDVYVGFHIVTPNRLVEIPAWRFVWQVKTRPCTLVTTTQVVACGGPCGCPATQVAANLVCSAGYDPIPTSLGCTGPFDSWSSCNAGALARVLYYNCTMTCTSTVCS